MLLSSSSKLPPGRSANLKARRAGEMQALRQKQRGQDVILAFSSYEQGVHPKIISENLGHAQHGLHDGHMCAGQGFESLRKHQPGTREYLQSISETRELVGREGLEPPTPGLKARRSAH